MKNQKPNDNISGHTMQTISPSRMDKTISGLMEKRKILCYPKPSMPVRLRMLLCYNIRIWMWNCCYTEARWHKKNKRIWNINVSTDVADKLDKQNHKRKNIEKHEHVRNIIEIRKIIKRRTSDAPWEIWAKQAWRKKGYSKKVKVIFW